MNAHIIIVKKLDAPNSFAVTKVYEDVVAWALAHGVRYHVYDSDKTFIRTNTDGSVTSKFVVVAIGGDGTVIAATKIGWSISAPVIGFNLGKVGFLADFSPRSVDQTLTAWVHGRLDAEARSTIQCFSGEDAGPESVAVNDIVVSCAQSDTSLEYDLMVSDAFAGTHVANGVIFSTPTGSTAYALGVGGSIIMPECMDIIQVAPIAPQTLSSRPLIIPASCGASLRFMVKPNKPVTVRVDGVIIQTLEAIGTPAYHTVLVRKAVEKVQLLHHSGWNHFDTLTQKLGWNK